MELHDDLGEHDGAIKGVRYFTCPAKRGIIVQKSTLKPEKKINPDLFEEIEINRNISARIEGIVCNGCGYTKICQQDHERCKICHDYDGTEEKKCIGCDVLLCNRCINLNEYENCAQCGDWFCWQCEEQLYAYCTYCNNRYCGKCMKAYELFTTCERCDDKICNDCAPCLCPYGHNAVLCNSGSSDMGNKNDSKHEKILVVD